MRKVTVDSNTAGLYGGGVSNDGGEATLVRVREIEGLPNEKLIGMFNDARDKEYAAVSRALRVACDMRP